MLLGQQAVLATWHICYVRIEIASFSCSWLGRFGYGSKLYCLSRKTTLLRLPSRSISFILETPVKGPCYTTEDISRDYCLDQGNGNEESTLGS